MTHEVRWAEAAVKDLEDIIAFAAAESPMAGRRLLAAIEQRAASPERAPNRGRVVPELAAIGAQAWRELIIPPHRLVYRVEGRAVWVLALLDGRRDLQDVLLERLLQLR